MSTNYRNELRTGNGKKVENVSTAANKLRKRAKNGKTEDGKKRKTVEPISTIYRNGLKTGTKSCNPRLICVRLFILSNIC